MGEIAKRDGRASIAAGGFGPKWQNALRANVYPRGGDSIRAAAVIYHKVPYAIAFEEGAIIQGKPLLWLPLPTVPIGRGGRPIQPRSSASRSACRFTPSADPASRRCLERMCARAGARAFR
jgi:hypothetical protein